MQEDPQDQEEELEPPQGLEKSKQKIITEALFVMLMSLIDYVDNVESVPQSQEKWLRQCPAVWNHHAGSPVGLGKRYGQGLAGLDSPAGARIKKEKVPLLI